MLADDIALGPIDGAHIRGWLDLLIPPGLAEGPRWGIAVLDRGKLVLALRGGDGALDLEAINYTGTSRAELKILRRSLRVDVLGVFERVALARLAATAEARLDLNAHYTAQSLVWLDAFRGELRRGIWIDPPLADLIPPLRSDALERTFDLLVANNTAMVATIIDDDRKDLCASVIAVKRDGVIAEVSTYGAIADRLASPTLARSWTTQYRRANALIGERFADVSIGLYAERGAIRRILGGPADQLSREISGKGLIIDPMPRWLSALIGGANAAAIASRGAKRLGALLPAPARRAARSIAAETQRRARASGAHPWQVLGFDPLELWRKVRGYYR